MSTLPKPETVRQKEPLSLRQRLLLALLTPLITILIVSSFFDYRLATQTANAAHTLIAGGKPQLCFVVVLL